MRDTLRFSRWIWQVLLLATSCATAGSGAPRGPTGVHVETYDTVTVTRDAQVVHFQVMTGQRCNGAGQLSCAQNEPAADTAIVLRTSTERHLLGSTAQDGRLAVPLSAFDELFRGQTVAADQVAQLLVHDSVAAELPLGEIVNRQSVIDSAISECDQALAAPSPDRDYVQLLLGRLLDLQMRGIADPRIADRTSRLYERLRQSDSLFAAPRRWLGRAQELLAHLRSSGDEQAVPTQVQNTIDTTDTSKTVEPHSFKWALSVLPTMCKITVRGGAVVAGQMIATGAPGVALAIIAASVGDDLSDWLVKSCCDMASRSISGSASPNCAGKNKSAPSATTQTLSE
jgi:hypothetical protein